MTYADSPGCYTFYDFSITIKFILKIICFYFITTSLFSCNKDKDLSKIYYQKENALQFDEKITLDSSNNIYLPVDSSFVLDFCSIQFLESPNGAYLAFFDPKIPGIHIYNFDNLNKEKTLTFELEGPNGVGTNTSNMGCFIYSLDSILIHNYWSNKLMLFNSYAEKQFSLDIPYPDLAFFSCAFADSQPFKVGKLILLPNTYQGIIANELIASENIPAFLALEPSSQKMFFIGNRSDVYDVGYNITGDNSLVYGTYNGYLNKVIYSFRQDHYLFQTDIKGEKSKHFVGSKFFQKIPPLTLNLDDGVELENSRSEAVIEYMRTTPKYDAIKYDPFKRLYYRFCFLPRSKEEYIESRFRLKPSILVIDEGFKKIGEIAIDPKRYYAAQKLPHSFVTKKGLLIPWKNNESEDTLVFKIFEVRELKH